MAKRGQRGTLRIESGSYRGLWNEYVLDPITGKKMRKQRRALLESKSLGKFAAYDLLRKEIERTIEGDIAEARPDPGIALERFTRTRWLPQIYLYACRV